MKSNSNTRLSQAPKLEWYCKLSIFEFSFVTTRLAFFLKASNNRIAFYNFNSILECSTVTSSIYTCFQCSISIDTSRYSALISRWHFFIFDICVGAGGGGSMGQTPNKQSENDKWPPMTQIIVSIPEFGQQALPHISKTFLRQCLRQAVLRNVYSDHVEGPSRTRTDLYRGVSCRSVLRIGFPESNYWGPNCNCKLYRSELSGPDDPGPLCNVRAFKQSRVVEGRLVITKFSKY